MSEYQTIIETFRQDVQASIKALRKKSGFSQSELGRMLGVSAQQIQKYEAGRDRISAERYMAICFIADAIADLACPYAGLSNADRGLLQALALRLARKSPYSHRWACDPSGLPLA